VAEDVLRRALEANLQYYAALGRLTVDYLEALGSIARQVEVPARTLTFRQTAPATPAPAPAPPAVTVLEAEAGGTAIGVFLVENLLTEKVSAPVSASAVAAPDGREVAVPLAFEPEVVVLEPGEQILVRVAARVDDGLEADVSYRAEVAVPGVIGTRVPIVVRRRAA
jgi:O-phosphoseryl-tRNA(Cys) synthetase